MESDLALQIKSREAKTALQPFQMSNAKPKSRQGYFGTLQLSRAKSIEMLQTKGNIICKPKNTKPSIPLTESWPSSS
jgi:hypothetical protein